MKKLFPIALLMCMAFSLSSFAPGNAHPAVVKKVPLAITWPITGQTFARLGVGQPWGLIDYTIVGGGTAPTSVTLYNAATGQQIGDTYWFTGGPIGYFAQGMYTETEITAFQFVVDSSRPEGYVLSIIAP